MILSILNKVQSGIYREKSDSDPKNYEIAVNRDPAVYGDPKDCAFPRLKQEVAINRIHHWCSVGTGKSQPEIHYSSGLAEFTTGTVIDSFSHTPSPDDHRILLWMASLCLNRKVNERNKHFRKVKQFWYQTVPFFFFFFFFSLRKRILIYLIFYLQIKEL